MGHINLKEEKEILRYIAKRLKTRGLKPYLDNWEIHGPHQDMDYQVFIGEVKGLKTKKYKGLVVIYPRSIYWLEDESDWWKCEKENRIFTN